MKTRRGNSEQGKAGRSPREAVALKEQLSKRLKAYALAAGAASVGALALARPAEANIILTTLPNPEPFSGLDLNNDGLEDFNGHAYVTGGPNGTYGHRNDFSVFLFGPNSNKLVDLPLVKGAFIGPGDVFTSVESLRHSVQRTYYRSRFRTQTVRTTYAFGPWVGVQSGYLGLHFVVDAKAYYGWALLTNGAQNLVSYAYDTVPNQPILAGQTSASEPSTLSMLGLLALGSLGLGLWRRKKQESDVRS